MEQNNLKSVISSLSKLIEDNEKISLSVFSSKLSKASEMHPEDYTLGMMANITSRMSSNKLFITRAEIKDLYNRLYSRNTKFAELFSNELGEITKAASPKIYDRSGDDESLSLLKTSYDKIVDPVLANSLKAAFGDKTKPYSEVIATKAKTLCENQLGCNAAVLNGNDNFIICNASFDTPKGQTSILIPIEVVGSKTLIPSVFVGNNGPEDISEVKNYILNNAGNKLNINHNDILTALASKSDISNVDLALIKLNASKETKSEYSSNSVLYQKLDEENDNLTVNTPTYKDKEIETFASSFDTPIGIANFNFGKDIVKSATNCLKNKLEGFGIKNIQMSVCDVNKDGIVIAASTGKNAFKVPIKIANGKISSPSLMIVNGSVRDLSKKSFQEIVLNNETDHKVASVASALYGLKASELVDIVRVAMNEENYSRAEDALNVLANCGDDKAYKSAFVAYSNGLNLMKTASEEKTCNMIVKNAHTSHELCGHTGLPLHKTYRDANGDCHPLYRKGMEDTKEGAYFMNSKIFF